VPARPLYLYCVTRAGQPLPSGATLVEPAAGPVRAVAGRTVAVLASPVRAAPVRMTASNLEAHHMAVESAYQQGTVLPFRFGLVVEDEEQLHGFLEESELGLGRMLDRFRGLGEVRLSVRYAGDAGLREAAASDRRIVTLRRKLRDRPPDATYYQRIELGEAVAAALDRLRAEDADGVSAKLRRATIAERRLEARAPEDVLRGAYLLKTSRLREFDEAVSRLAAAHEGRMDFAAVGPLAPWDFVELEGVEQRPRSRLRRAEAGA
jgi:hypothetical protein